MPPTNEAPKPDQVDTRKVEKTGDTTATTETHDETGKPAVHTEKQTVEKPKE